MNNKYDKLGQSIAKQLAIILQREVRDPRIGIVTISEVKLTKDLSLAKIYITALNKLSDLNDRSQQITTENNCVALLNKMSGFLRTELAHRLQVRSVPAIKFYYDELLVNSNRIENLLDDINKENQSNKNKDSGKVQDQEGSD